VNKAIPTLLRVCAWLSYVVMLTASTLRGAIFLLSLMVAYFFAGLLTPLGSDSLIVVAGLIYVLVLPLASVYYYFRWPWGPVLVCWFAIAMNLSNAFPLERHEDGSYFYPHTFEMAFFIAAHLGLVSYLVLKRSGLWPFKTHKEAAVSREQIVGE
jgi:hypothetical protein